MPSNISIVLLNTGPATIAFILAYFAYVRFILEWLFMPKVFKEAYTDLTIPNKRSFTTHVLWLTIKICLIPAFWPFANVFFLHKQLGDYIYTGSGISNADWLSLAYMAVISMFLFEIVFRLKISPVALLHHVAGCALSSWQIVEQVNAVNASTNSQFRLLILYGFFEVVFETFPHIAVVYYRCQPKTSLGAHKTSRIWLISGWFSLVGTTAELITMGVFMWKNWKYWDLGMRIVLPILHFAFMAAQVHGARVGFQLHRDFKRRAEDLRPVRSAEIDASSEDVEKGGQTTVVIAPYNGFKAPKAHLPTFVRPANPRAPSTVSPQCIPGSMNFPNPEHHCCSCAESDDSLQLPMYPGV